MTLVSSSGREMFSTVNELSSRPSAAKEGCAAAAIFCARAAWLLRHIEEGNIAGGEDVGHAGDDGLAELAFEVGDVVGVARAGDFGEELARVLDAVSVDAIAAQADGAEFLFADGDGRGGAPLLIHLQAGGEEVDVGLEGRLEALVPVHEVGEQGQVAGVEGVEAGAKDVGDAALVHKGGQLRLAHGELPPFWISASAMG